MAVASPWSQSKPILRLYGNPWSNGGSACINTMVLPPNTLAPTTSRDSTRFQSISLLATSFEFGICVHPHFSCDEDVIDRVAVSPSGEIYRRINS
jgi:hypothetical protein